MNKTLTTTMLATLGCVLCFGALAQSDEMPAPRRMPRAPVSREVLQERNDVAPAARIVQGPAAIIDGEHLRIADTDLRLFGVVPPQLGASFGPQARSALDTLAGGQSVSCQIRDRDHDGRLLATCRSANGSDMALDLLRRGLAVTARGSLAGTELATPYLAAEQAAQAQKSGLWSVTVPAAATVAANTNAPLPALHSESAALPATPRSDKAPEQVAAPATQPPVAETQTAAQAKIAQDVIDQHAQARIEDERWQQEDRNPGFFIRYQFLIAGFLMFATALSIIAALWMQKRRDKRDETKAVAAALRGELMAARGVCIGRIKSINTEEEDRAAIWPRIRSTLYQAYVGRLGLLGAELARQVASIYGQSSDYAALYSPTGAAHDASKKGALETLVRHIDEILPKLAGIEQTGFLPMNSYVSRQLPPPRSRYDAPLAPPAAKPMLQGSYKTIAPPAARKTDAPQTDPAYRLPDSAPPAAATPPLSPVALWESVRGFIQNHRNAIADPYVADPADAHITDAHVHEYAAMIEADMARYPYRDPAEGFESPFRKRRG